ncbi:MAG: Ig-like domain-containing protein, partial [Nitrospirae bacterium]|nr:Ig-like domain-containing protein [Nitrospirota bacterium]
KIVYKFKDTGVVLANTEGTVNLISGKDNEIFLAPPEKDIDDDGDGFKNFYEILQGTNPKDPGSKPVEDKTPPSVSSTDPVNGSTNIPVNSKISATFSEPIDSKTMTKETFTVSNGSTNIPGTVALNDMTATFTPTGSLSYNTTYTAGIGTGGTGAKDLAGNPMAGSYSWSFSTEISSGTKPSAPIGVTAKAGDTQITISWNAVSGATSYNIYWSTTSGVSKTTGTKISNVKSPYLHPGLTNGTTYRYVVTAVNSYGESVESDQTSAKYTSVITLDTTPPANTTGTNFINSGASASNSTSVTLSISATDSVGVTGYFASENSATPLPSDAG